MESTLTYARRMIHDLCTTQLGRDRTVEEDRERDWSYGCIAGYRGIPMSDSIRLCCPAWVAGWARGATIRREQIEAQRAVMEMAS